MSPLILRHIILGAADKTCCQLNYVTLLILSYVFISQMLNVRGKSASKKQ